MTECPSTVRRDYSFFTCSSVDGHSVDFHALAVVDSAAVNGGARVYFEIPFQFIEICVACEPVSLWSCVRREQNGNRLNMWAACLQMYSK